MNRKMKITLCVVSGITTSVTFSCMVAVLSYEGFKTEDGQGIMKVHNNSRYIVNYFFLFAGMLSKASLCVSCDDLTQNGTIPDLDQLVLKLKTSPDSDQCCFENSDHFSDFLESVLSEDELHEEPLPTFDPGNFSLSKASAHRRLVPQNWFERNTVKFFDHDLELGLRPKIINRAHVQHERNVKIDTNGITIVLPGHYLVYSSVYLHPHTNTLCGDFDDQTWYIYIKRANPGLEPETLVTAVHTCSNDDIRVDDTIYLAGMFDFQADDQIRVYISGMGLIGYQIETTFLGVVKLG